jgi:integrase
MARKATGAVIEHTGNDGRTYRSLRFSAYGKRRFVSLGPVSATDAATELRYTLADVERGTWQPPQPVEPAAEPDPVPTFHQFAEQWWTRNHRRWASRTVGDYQWRLEKHLIPFFGGTPIDQITYDTVERYIDRKLAEGELGPRSINMTLTLLGAILEAAVERDLIAKNPAKGKQRRAPERTPRRTQLDSAAAIGALLEAAGTLDRTARLDGRYVHRRAILTTLVFSGLRVSELCDLQWRDVDLAGGWLNVQASKTDAGRRKVTIRGIVRDELLALKPADVDQGAYVFATKRGGRPNPSNIRNRVLQPAAELASEKLVADGGAPLPHLTPHSCRRTFASVLYALGEGPVPVQQEMGHTNPAMALAVYAQVMRRADDEKGRLVALVEGRGLDQMAVIGIPGSDTADQSDTIDGENPYTIGTSGP